MRYEFQAADGEVIEIDCSMIDAPPIGKRIEKDGKAFVRVPSIPGVRIAPRTTIVSWTTEPNDPDAPHQVNMDGTLLTAFDSRREIDNWMAKRNDKQQGEGKYVYDPHAF